jgi:drug/metabolite transporter (DMT)-like permease
VSDYALFLAAGLSSAAGLMCIGIAYQTAPSPTTVAPYHYTQIIWGAIIGYLYFNETPDARLMTGAMMIIGVGLYLILHETRRFRKKVPAAGRDV